MTGERPYVAGERPCATGEQSCMMGERPCVTGVAIKKGMFLNSTVSSPLDRSKRFDALFLPWQT